MRPHALVVALCAGVLALAGAAGADDSAPSTNASFGIPPELVPQFQQEMDAAAVRQAELSQPDAVAERERSRTAYDDLDPGQALDLADREFPRVFDEPLWQPPRLPAGDRVKRYLSDSTFVVNQANGSDVLVESSAPVRARRDDGSTAPVDTDLEHNGTSLEPANTDADPRISTEGGTAALPHAGVSFHVAGADAASARVVDDKAIYPNALPDADVALAALDSGVQALFQLRAADSPEEQTLSFNLPDGATLRLTSQGSGMPAPEDMSAEVTRGDERLATIAAPRAVDADGQAVPAHYTVDGNRLTIHVPHRGGDWRYPILVDPLVDDFQWHDQADFGWDAQAAGWRFWPTQPPTLGSYTGYFDWFDCSTSTAGCPANTVNVGRGLFVRSRSGTYPTNLSALAVWGWGAPPNTNIVQVTFAQYMIDGPGTCAYGAISPGGTAKQGSYLWDCSPNPLAVKSKTICTSATTPCTTSPTGSTAGNYVEFGHVSAGNLTSPSEGWSYLGRVDVSMWEQVPPTVKGLVSDTAGAQAWTPPTAWVDHASPQFRAKVQDQGLGLGPNALTFSVDGATKATAGKACTGTHRSPCSTAELVLPDGTLPSPTGDPFSYNTDNLAEGVHNAQVSAKDLLGNTSPDLAYNWQIKVDRTPPSIDTSGTLTDGTTVSGDTPYTLHVHATDGSTASPASQRSGVQSVEILLDDEEQNFFEQECVSNGNCPLDADWSLTAADVPAGTHTVTIEATDMLGQVSSKTLTISRSCCFSHAAALASTSPTEDVQYGDVDADGAADAVSRDSLTGAIQVRLANDSGFDPPAQWGTWNAAYDFQVADIDGDGAADIVGRNATTGDIQVALSTQSGFSPATSWGTAPAGKRVQFADYDGDGAADLILRDPTSGDVSVAYSDGESSFEPPFSVGTFDNSYSLTVTDVDGDGMSDAVGRNPSTGDIRTELQSDHATLGSPGTWGSLPGNYDTVVADVNGDQIGDVTARNTSTGDVKLMPSTTSQFEAPTPAGTYSPGYTLNAADVTGDSRDDLVGTDPAGGIEQAVSSAKTPAQPDADAPAADDTASDVDTVPAPDTDSKAAVDAITAGSCPDANPATAGPNRKLFLAFQADGPLVQRKSLLTDPNANPFAAGSADQAARCAQNRLYARMRQTGASVVRFNASWGQIENAPNPDGTYPQSAGCNKPCRWDFSILDKAVEQARANGFRVLLTLTGWTGKGECPGPLAKYRNGYGVGCVVGGTGDNPCPENTSDHPCPHIWNYRRFVQEAVDHYTHDANGNQKIRVQWFSLWNEPNLFRARGGTFLNPSETARKKHVVPVTLYGQLYAAGYLGYKDGLGTVTGPKILIGELAPKDVTGRAPGTACTTEERGTPRCHVGVKDFLRGAVHAAGDFLASKGLSRTVHATGLALHPYQDAEAPWRKTPSKREWYGIGRLGAIKALLCDPGASGTCTHQLQCRPGDCSNTLVSLDGGTPGLFLTEFGYHNRGGHADTDPRKYHRESTRAGWFQRISKNGKTDGALQQARDHNARMMVIYELVENEPDNQADTGWDTGVIAAPTAYMSDGTKTFPPVEDNEIVGCRDYGKPLAGGKWKYSPNNCPPFGQPTRTEGAQYRMAYCAIRRWAARDGFMNRRKDPYDDACNPPIVSSTAP